MYRLLETSTSESDWYFYYEESTSEFGESRYRSEGRSESEPDGETLKSYDSTESLESSNSMGSFLTNSSGHTGEDGAGRISPELRARLGGRLGRSGNIFNDFWDEYNRVHERFGRKIISSVVDLAGGIEQFKRILPEIIKGSKRRLFTAVCFHDQSCGATNGPHMHFHHECPWNSQRCNCFRVLVRPRERTQHSCGEGSRLYVDSVLKYYGQDPRWFCYVAIGKRNWSTVLPGENIQYERCDWRSIPGAIEESNYQLSNLDNSGQSNSVEVARSSTRLEVGFRRQGGARKAIPRTLEEFILDYPSYPVINIMETKVWEQSEYKYLLSNDRVLQRALQAVQVKYMNMTYDDFVKYYNELPEHHLYFARGNVPMYDYYFNIDTSLKHIEEVLEYHLNPDGDQPHKVGQFFQDVYNIIEKRLPKKNTLYIVGAASSGKNYIIDSLSAFLINVGNMANFNKYSQFPFNDCKSRRLIIWNEPNFVESAIDTLKMATGGDPLPCNIKNKDHYIMPRTPLIIMSNHDRFKPNKNPPFAERFITYTYWNALPWPKVDKKPHPLVWIKAFEKYNCVQYKNKVNK